MPRSLNEVTLIGNVGQSPELKSTSGGKRYANISIATTRSFKDAKGEWQEKTEWHRVKAWNQYAELVEKYVNKGDRIFVRAHLEYSNSGEGELKKYYTDIVVNNIILLGNKPSGDAPRSESRPTSQAPKADMPPFPDTGTVMEENDDLPF